MTIQTNPAQDWREIAQQLLDLLSAADDPKSGTMLNPPHKTAVLAGVYLAAREADAEQLWYTCPECGWVRGVMPRLILTCDGCGYKYGAA